jgi:hypothetical protein
VAFGDIIDSYAEAAESSITLNYGTDVATPTEGNLLLMVFGDRSNGTTTPSGWTEIYTVDPWSNSSSTRTCVYAKIASASESNVTFSVTNGRPAFAYYEVEGPFEALSGSPLDIIEHTGHAEATNVDEGTGLQPGTSGTLSQADTFALAATTWRGTSGSNYPTSTAADSGFTASEFTGYNGFGAFTYGLISAYKVTSATTALNPSLTWTQFEDNSPYTAVSVLVVLKKEAAGGPDYTLTADSGSFTLTGQDVDLLASRLLAAASGSYTLTGQDVALLRGFLLSAASGSFTLTGQDVGLLRGLLLAAESGSFTYSGQDAALVVSRLLGAESGSFTLTGQDVTLTYTPLTGYTLVADSGSFTLTGQDVGLIASRLLGAASGSFTLTGQDTGLLVSRLLDAASGSFTLTGQDVTLTYSGEGAPDYTLTAESGAFTLTGQDISLLVGRLLTADSASFTLTGQDVDLLRGYTLAAASGDFTLAGQDVGLVVSRVLNAASGEFTLAGQNVTLVYSAAPSAVTPAGRTFVVSAESRVFVIPTEDRTYIIFN